MFWDRIVSIDYVGYEHVYDIEVEGTHNFIANGIIAHNTYLKKPEDAEEMGENSFVAGVASGQGEAGARGAGMTTANATSEPTTVAPAAEDVSGISATDKALIEMKAKDKTLLIIDNNSARQGRIIRRIKNILDFKEIIPAGSLEEVREKQLAKKADYVVDFTSNEFGGVIGELFGLEKIEAGSIKVGLGRLGEDEAMSQIKKWLYTQL